MYTPSISQLFILGTGLLSTCSRMVAAQQQNGTQTNGPQVQVTSANDFCLFLPPQPGLEVAVNEDNGVPFCMNPTTVQGSQPFPQGFITTAHYHQTDSYTQITGFFDRSKYNLSQSDGGGQYDSHANHKPTGGSCQHFPYFVSMIEPSNNRFCIRCCQNTDDCKTGISQNGCARVVTPGNYDENNAFDDVPPSDSNQSGGGATESGSSGPSVSASGATPSNSVAPSDESDASSPSASGAAPSSSAAPAVPGDDGSGTDGSGNEASGGDDGEDQQHANTSYNSVLDELDTSATSSSGTNGTDTSNNSNDIKTVNDEAKYIQSQLQNPQADLNALKTQFTTFTNDLATRFPDAADKIKQLESITSNYQTADQWKHLATILQQQAPNASAGN
ncbi:hypothetical protein BC941DRAFT_417736 [Chlamydoabsidia padenii]|nr:hypothetical protein BC941DRAFT_417736 [Chlamydoabsidia padenii]